MSSLVAEEIPDDVRTQVIRECQALLDDPGQSPFELPRRVRKLSRVTWFWRMLDDYEQFEAPRLPYSPNDRTTHEDDARAALERLIIFLGNGRHYDDGVSRSQRSLFYLFGAFVFGSILAFMACMLGEHYYGEDSWVGRLVPYTLGALAIGIGSLFLLYFAGQILSGIHIFRVRVLRQDLTPAPSTDIWPYLDTDDFRLDFESG